MRHRLTALVLATAVMVAGCSDSTGPAAPTIAGRWVGAAPGVVFRMHVDSVADNGAGGNLRGWFVHAFTDGVTPGDSAPMVGRATADSVVVEFAVYEAFAGSFRSARSDDALPGLVRSGRLAIDGVAVTLTRQD
jgi:hypothetical protein